MWKNLKKIIWKFLNSLKIGGPVQLLNTGALIDDGWYNSFYKKMSIDKNNNPTPWYTYSFLKFIEPRLKKHFHVFEFGAGNSTLWYSNKVCSINSVDHNKNWYDQLLSNLPSNTKIVFKELTENGEYSKEVLNSNKNFHIIVVDGEDRNNCIKNSFKKLTEDGVIIFDNTERTEYNESYKLLQENGFKRIDFIGMGPIGSWNFSTSVFYKNNNCLGI